MTPRIYCPISAAPHDQLELSGDELHYLARVMRAKVGDRVELFNGFGQRCGAEVLSLGKSTGRLQAFEWITANRASRLELHLIQGLSSADKMDWTVEKAVELGVAAIQAVRTERALVRLDPQRAAAKLAHWQRLAVAACRQSGQDRLPRIAMPMDLSAWLAQPNAARHDRLMLSVPSAAAPTAALSAWQPMTPPPLAVDILVGPESGLAPGEHEAALRAGFQAVRLGPLILRTETAGLAALAALQTRFGDF